MTNPMPTLAAVDTLWQFRIPTSQSPPLFVRLHTEHEFHNKLSLDFRLMQQQKL